jgi:hypothetical protein
MPRATALAIPLALMRPGELAAAAHGGLDVPRTVLLLAALAAAWVLSLLVHPFSRCWLCRGKGNLRRSGGRRAPRCPLCKGRRRRQRTGSRAVHRIRRQVVTHWRGPR